MRTRIVFSLKNKGAFAPFHYQYMIDATIRKVISQMTQKKFRDYTHYNFSSLKGQIKVAKGGIRFFSRRLTLVFSSPNVEFAERFLETLFQQDTIFIGDLQLAPEEVVEENPVDFTTSTRFLCISPIVLMVDDPDVQERIRFISPEVDTFSDLLYESTISRMEASGQYTDKELDGFYQFQLVPDQEYLGRMEETGKRYARICTLYDNDQEIEVRSYTFPFTMYAPIPVQRFLYENGLGRFCNKGFGMLDLAHATTIRSVRQPRIEGESRPPLYA